MKVRHKPRGFAREETRKPVVNLGRLYRRQPKTNAGYPVTEGEQNRVTLRGARSSAKSTGFDECDTAF